MKRYLAVIGALCAITVTTIAALRITSDTWAVLVGILVGGLAATPMLMIVLVWASHREARGDGSFERSQPQFGVRPQPQRLHQPVRITVPPAQATTSDAYVEAEFYEYDEHERAHTPRATVVKSSTPSGYRVIGR